MKKQLDKEIASLDSKEALETAMKRSVKESYEMEQQSIDYHLREALAHLETALNKSVHNVLENEHAKKEIGHKWEGFLGEFFGYIREKGKKSKLNLLNLISFPRFR